MSFIAAFTLLAFGVLVMLPLASHIARHPALSRVLATIGEDRAALEQARVSPPL